MLEFILKENEVIQMFDKNHDLIGSLFYTPNHRVLIDSIGTWECIQLQVDYVLVATYWCKTYELYKMEELKNEGI